MGTLEGKVAIITGAARGQGEAEARLFVAEGAKVMLTDVLREGEGVSQALGDLAAFSPHDVGSAADWERVVKTTKERFGRIDVLVNNAAIYRMRSLIETSEEDFDEIIRVNQRGVFLGMRAAAPVMQSVGGGSIINISSGAGLKGVRNMIAYATSQMGGPRDDQVRRTRAGVIRHQSEFSTSGCYPNSDAQAQSR